MIGHIDYINLLPFYMFMKRYHYYTTKKSYPAKINKMFEKKIVDCAFISSIKSSKKNCLDAGIVANKKVLSVLVCEGENKEDFESNTSNILAKVLNLSGEVIIGDKALSKYYNESNNCQDLAKLWYEKYKLPFVFARFCINKNYNTYSNLIDLFLKQKIYIPQYILKKYAKRANVSPKEIKEYLDLISYELKWKEKKSLKKFLKLSKKLKT